MKTLFRPGFTGSHCGAVWSEVAVASRPSEKRGQAPLFASLHFTSRGHNINPSPTRQDSTAQRHKQTGHAPPGDFKVDAFYSVDNILTKQLKFKYFMHTFFFLAFATLADVMIACLSWFSCCMHRETMWRGKYFKMANLRRMCLASAQLSVCLCLMSWCRGGRCVSLSAAAVLLQRSLAVSVWTDGFTDCSLRENTDPLLHKQHHGYYSYYSLYQCVFHFVFIYFVFAFKV